MTHLATGVFITAIACVALAESAAAAQGAKPLQPPHQQTAKPTHFSSRSLSAADHNPFSYGGTIRAFYFTRTNLVQNKSNPNRSAFNFGGKLHGEYRFGDSPWIVGATYFGAEPLGTNGTNPGFRSSIDNTLPGFALSTLGEAYLQFKNPYIQAKIGNQVINTPWANSSDSRIKPVAFQGFDGQFQIAKGWTLGLDDMIRFEHRTSSSFFKRTLLTDAPAGNPSYPIKETNGFLLASIGYKHANQFAATLYDYRVYDIANLLYFEGKYTWDPRSKLKPFIATQFVRETQTGSALVGIINNKTVGAQLGASVRPNVDAAIGWDSAPWRSAVFAKTCSNAGTTYFLPAGGTTGCVNNRNGTSTVYYGGIASPYTEAYATDPLFTTSISQGMADRHSAGDAYKIGSTIQTMDKRAKLILSEAYYFYGNVGGPNKTREFNADLTLYFNRVGSGAYHGLSLRHRYADRRQPTAPNDFKYNRTQLQWDF